LNSWWGTYFSCYHMNNAIHNLFCSYYICTGIFICTGLCICRGVVAQWYKKKSDVKVLVLVISWRSKW
jgi:hypothetical protein